jgi:hypothetical protein
MPNNPIANIGNYVILWTYSKTPNVKNNGMSISSRFYLKKTDSDLHSAQSEPFKPSLPEISRFSTGYPYCDGR